MGGDEFTEWMTILGEFGVKAEKIRRKHSNHKNGPIVEPRPGPKRIQSGWLAYPVDDIP
jgi:hypothetical protein